MFCLLNVYLLYWILYNHLVRKYAGFYGTQKKPTLSQHLLHAYGVLKRALSDVNVAYSSVYPVSKKDMIFLILF
jgi:hypothetical protein